MKSITQWLEEYGVSHQNKTNKIIHYVCVPAIYMTVLGLLWSIPFPFADMPMWVNWSTIIAIPALLFYFSLSFVVGIGMTLFTALMLMFLQWWQLNMAELMSVLTMSIVVFVVAWVLQFVGHHIEGKKPSFLKDLQFLLIGPAWILCFVYKKLNIRF